MLLEQIALSDFAPKQDDFYDEVIRGLQCSYKTLPCKFFYDARGSQLFDQICALDEYYPTRTEMGIMQAHIGEMVSLLGTHCRLVEYGSGSSTKTRLLLDAARELAAYVPVDISRAHLLESARHLMREYPQLEVLPVCADYTMEFALPHSAIHADRTVVYFPGSTIGNFPPKQAQTFLARIAALCGRGGGILVGVDLKKAPQILEPAYNDRQGVTAAFNLNLLIHINRELGADFDLAQFEHHAFYNPFAGRIEMHLVSLRDQEVHIGGIRICFDADETIHTESSYKYSLPQFAQLAQAAGFAVQQVWTDDAQFFSVQYLTVA